MNTLLLLDHDASDDASVISGIIKINASTSSTVYVAKTNVWIILIVICWFAQKGEEGRLNSPFSSCLRANNNTSRSTVRDDGWTQMLFTHILLSVCFSRRWIPTAPLLLPFFFFFLKSDWKPHLGNQGSPQRRLLSQTSSLGRRRCWANFPVGGPLFPPVSVLNPKFKGLRCASASSAPRPQLTHTHLTSPPLPCESPAASWRPFPFHSTRLAQISHLSGRLDPQMTVRTSDWNPYRLLIPLFLRSSPLLPHGLHEVKLKQSHGCLVQLFWLVREAVWFGFFSWTVQWLK